MRNSEKRLYEQEAEVRPNRYVMLALMVLSFSIIAMLLINELGIFLVVKERMRFGVFTALIILIIPQFAAGTDAGLKNPHTKYLMIACTGLVAAILCVVLNFHATLILLLPVLLAAQYPFSKLSRIAVICSMICAFFAPVIGYLSGMWDTAFIQRLCEISGQEVLLAAEEDRMKLGMAVAQIILYLSVPHTLIILALSPLSTAIAKSEEKRLENQIQVLHMSESDTLTGLLNRLSFEKTMTNKVLPSDGNVAVIFVDANNLHRLNNEQGHSEGDRMLICVADSLRNVFDDESVYRTGGDEFIVIFCGLSLVDVRARVEQARMQIEKQNYSVAVGIEYAQPPCSLKALVDSAETKMMIDKEKYHIVR